MCVICWKPTEYYVGTPIDQRRNYREGAGQLCEECAGELNDKSSKEAKRREISRDYGIE